MGRSDSDFRHGMVAHHERRAAAVPADDVCRVGQPAAARDDRLPEGGPPQQNLWVAGMRGTTEALATSAIRRFREPPGSGDQISSATTAPEASPVRGPSHGSQASMARRPALASRGRRAQDLGCEPIMLSRPVMIPPGAGHTVPSIGTTRSRPSPRCHGGPPSPSELAFELLRGRERARWPAQRLTALWQVPRTEGACHGLRRRRGQSARPSRRRRFVALDGTCGGEAGAGGPSANVEFSRTERPTRSVPHQERSPTDFAGDPKEENLVLRQQLGGREAAVHRRPASPPRGERSGTGPTGARRTRRARDTGHDPALVP